MSTPTVTQNPSTMERLRGLRLELGVSIEEMAQSCGVDAAAYESVESGKTDASFTFLYRCANRLGVDLSAMVTGDEPRLSAYTLCRSGDGMPIRRSEGFEYQHIAYLLRDRLSEPFVVTAKYSSALEHAPIALTAHDGQELDYVLEGTLRVQIEDHVETLGPGDSVYYDGWKKHGMVAMGGRDCRFLSVVVKGQNQPGQEAQPVTQHPDRQLADTDRRVYKNFISETLDAQGNLEKIAYHPTPNFNFAYDCLDAIAQKNPDKLAMLWVEPGQDPQRFTFGMLSEMSNQAANYFARMGIGRGDKVMLVLRRHHQFWVAINALHKLGAIVVPATDQLVEKDFVYRFNAAHIKAVVATGVGGVAEQIEAALPKSPTVSIKLMAHGTRPGWGDFDAGMATESTAFARVQTEKDDTMIMYFTSGTTGYPKIVRHDFTYPLAHVITAKWWQNVDPEGLHFTVSDTGWAKSVWGKLYGQWLCEAAVFTCDFTKFAPVDLLPMFKKYGITTFCAPPTIFRFFIKEDLSRFDMSSLKYAVIAGEALNPEVYQQFYEATGMKLMEGYGQTESTLTVFNHAGMTPKPGSMGKPSAGYHIVLLDAQGNPTPMGDTGEICIRTAEGTPTGMFRGYYEDEEKTAEVWHDGHYHTGDMAWQDEDGYFWYVGRTDDLIKSSGYRIGPFEIESVLMEMPCVMECAVTGVPDTTGERGQLVKATIILAPDYAPSDALKKEIQAYVKSHTAPYKYPRIIEFVETLPKTISGKIRRVALRENANV